MKLFFFQIYGDGSNTRSFQYVSDLVDGLIKLMNSNYTGPVNIGNPTEHTIQGKTLFSDICGLFIVLYFCVGFRKLSHLARDLSQAEKEINVVTS